MGYAYNLEFMVYFAPHISAFMKQILSEKNLVVILFVLVLITFSLAQEDSKKMEKIYTGGSTTAANLLIHYLEKDGKNSLTPAGITE